MSKFAISKPAGSPVELSPAEMTEKMVQAILKNDVAAINALIVRGADVNASDAKGNSLILIAATDPREHRALEALIAAQADPNKPSANGRMALHSVLRMKDDKLMPAAAETLFKAKADPNIVETRPNNPPQTAFQVAYEQNRHDRVLEMLLKNGADPTIGEDMAAKIVAPLHALAWTGRYGVLEAAYQNGVNLDKPASDGMTCLMLAAREGATKTVEVLLECNADPTLVDRRGQDAIAYAHKSPPETDKRAMLKLLVRAARDFSLHKEIAKLRHDIDDLRRKIEKPA
ncbi:MAG: hypothetical protein PSY14_05470 [bacterium]|nr:hypothetical protein [bacterium]